MSTVIALLSGLIFGLGLIASGMTDPAKVQGFLDLAGRWDPSLALVMGGAIGVGVFAFAAARRQAKAWSGERIEIPNSKVIDARLVGGGALFGAGWAVAGFCPGPAIVSLGAGQATAAIFIVAMLTGMLVHDRVLARS
jgi:uncharacterized membrane protein YedE/YeeE